jgi:hypothetical protein
VTTRAIAFVVNKDTPTQSNVVIRRIGVGPPVMLANIEFAPVTYTENDAAVVVSATITVAGSSSAEVSGVTVQIMAGFNDGDVLTVNGLLATLPTAATVGFDAATGTLSLAGAAAPIAEWQTVLRAISFSSTSDDPTGTLLPSFRVVAFAVQDAAGKISNVVIRDVIVVPVNDVTVLAGVEASALAYTEAGAPIAVSPSITVSDADYITNANLVSASVQIESDLDAGDVLSAGFLPAGITATYDAAAGRLALAGSAPQYVWQSVLRSVTFFTLSGEDPVVKVESNRKSAS